ncbi:MAG: adenine nucleotide alpha hydrolase family protein [Planctomycetota bacterium]|jgi:hypothetical protein
MKLIVSYGGGVNSTAMLIGCVRRNITPDAILFADTGGELPTTYGYVMLFSEWLVSQGFPTIHTVHYAGKHATLEEDCLNTCTLPSLAYGSRTCSQKYKIAPQDAWIKQQGWDTSPLRKAIGIHAGEAHRAKRESMGNVEFCYPLIEWGWDEEDCVDVIRNTPIDWRKQPPPHKSACFFCPACKKHEVLKLAQCWPDHFERACAIEGAAKAAGKLKTVKGLGRHWSWRALVDADRAQLALMPEATGMPCMCGL